MKRSVTILMAFAALLALNSILVAQKGKSKTGKAKSTATAPATNPGYIGETEKNLSKTKSTKPPTNAAVFEPNDEPRSNSSVPVGTAKPRKPGQIMDIVDMAKTDGPNSVQPSAQPGTSTPPKQGIAVAELNRDKGKGTKNFNDIIVSSKTTKPKAKPTKSRTAKPKPLND